MKRAEVERLLERVALGDEDALDQLLTEVEKEGPATRKLLLDALNQDGEEMWQAVILTLADDPYEMPPTTLSHSPDQAEETGRVPPETIRALQFADDRHERVNAAHELASWADPATVPALIDALDDDRLVANAAMEALVEIGAPAVPALLEAAGDDNQQVRWHTTKALRHIGDERAAPVLVQALDDDNSGVRWLAAEGLVAIGAAAVEPLLREVGDRTVGARFRQGTYHVLNKVEGENETQTTWLRRLAQRIRREPTENMPILARQALDGWRSM